MKSVYLAGPMSGLKYDDAVNWRDEAQDKLIDYDIHCLYPNICPKSNTDKGISLPCTCGDVLCDENNIVKVDLDYIKQCNVVLANFNSDRVSIGTVFEIGYAVALGKLIVAIIADNNIHTHPFITKHAIIVKTLEEALELICTL